MSQKRFTNIWHMCRGNDLRASSGKFLRIKVCRPEILDFLGLCILLYAELQKFFAYPNCYEITEVHVVGHLTASLDSWLKDYSRPCF